MFKFFLSFYLLILLLLPLSSFTQVEHVITKDNIEEMLVIANEIEIKTGEQIVADKVLYFIDKHNIQFENLYYEGLVSLLRGVQLIENNKIELGEIEFKKSEKIFNELSKRTELAHTLNNLGGVRTLYEDYPGALEYGYKALEIFDETKDYNQMVDLYFNLAVRHRNLEEWEQTKVNSFKSIGLIKKTHTKKPRLKFLYNFIARAEINQGNYKTARLYLDTALSLIEESDNRNLHLIYRNYGELYKMTGNVKLSAEYFHKALVSTHQLSDSTEKTQNKKSLITDQLQSELDESKDRIINEQNLILVIRISFITLLFIISLWLIHLYRNQRKNIVQIKYLNNGLFESNRLTQESNANLKQKNTEVEDLLSLNEKTLFSKELRISELKIAVSKIKKDISGFIKSDSSINNFELVGVKRSLNSLVDENEMWEDFKTQFEKIRPKFFSKLTEHFTDLTVNDLKHCTYVISKLKSKEVAKLLNVSSRSVETTRYRLKKKLNLAKEDNLFDFLLNIP